jgi:hypothetical protein
LDHRTKPSIILTYKEKAVSISDLNIYSFAVWERAESPGPSLTDGQGMIAWSEVVGEPYMGIPNSLTLMAKG